MPAIPPGFRDSVVYVFPSRQAAAENEPLGGTGFLVGMPMEGYEDVLHTYVVTNLHALGQAERPAIRLNQSSGKWDTLETTRDEWLTHPDGDDVAVCLAGIHEAHNVRFVGSNNFVTNEMVDEGLVGLGDETFMVSRFSALSTEEGRYSRNAPVVRFGNIASDPLQLRHSKFGIEEESYLVESRSLSGHSGSPVFVWLDPARELLRPGLHLLGQGRSTWLLGIDWCHLRVRERLRDNGDDEVESDQWHIRANSGMMGVIPAWRIAEVMATDEAKAQRAVEKTDWEREHPPDAHVELDAADAPAEPELTRGEFFDALGKIKKGPTPDGSAEPLIE